MSEESNIKMASVSCFAKLGGIKKSYNFYDK